jgi:TRAP-type C4-dicarboxylate transport system substrate-binding protein
MRRIVFSTPPKRPAGRSYRFAASDRNYLTKGGMGMRFKKFSVCIMVLALTFLFYGPTTAWELKFGHYAAETHPGHKATLMFADAVKKRTNDEITCKIYPANQLGSPPEVFEKNVLDAIDMSLPTQGALDGPFMDWLAPELEKENLQ